MKSLLSAGHQVTMITPFQPQHVHENLTIINSITEKSLSTVAVPSKIWIFSGLLFTDVLEQDCLSLVKSKQMKVGTDFECLSVIRLKNLQW